MKDFFGDQLPVAVTVIANVCTFCFVARTIWIVRRTERRRKVRRA